MGCTERLAKSAQQPCRSCGSNDLKFFLCGKDFRHLVEGVFKYARCRSCGLIFISPMPDRQTIAGFYTTERYYPYHAFQASLVRRLKDTLLLHATKCYSDAANALERTLGRWVLAPIRKKIIPIPPSGNRILDLGCGDGSYMLTLKKSGWNVFGCELSLSGVAAAKQHGLDVFHGTLREACFDDDFFDAIRLEQVFEHIEDPYELLAEIRRILKPCGLLVIGVPNAGALSFKVFGRHWGLLGAPYHLYQYCSSSIETLLNRAGFQVVEFRYRTMDNCWLWSLHNLLTDKFALQLSNRFPSNLFNYFFKVAVAVAVVLMIRPLYFLNRRWCEVLQVVSSCNDGGKKRSC